MKTAVAISKVAATNADNDLFTVVNSHQTHNDSGSEQSNCTIPQASDSEQTMCRKNAQGLTSATSNIIIDDETDNVVIALFKFPSKTTTTAKTRLNGVARKRFRKLLAGDGMVEIQAWKAAAQQKSNLKRNRSDESMPENNNRKLQLK